jgi:hypothetical protein
MVLANRSPARVSRSNIATRDAWAALPSTLRECGEIAAQRLSGVLSDALRQAEQVLFSNSAQALTHGECEVMLNAAEFARAHRERMVKDFLAQFECRYVRACEYKPTVMTAFQLDFDASQLEIVQHDLLDDSLEPGMLAEAIQNASWLSMNDLTQCFGILLGADSIKPNEMPLSPKLIEAAVSEAIRDQPWRHDAKSQVIRSLRKFFPDRVGLIYRDLAQHLRPMLGLAVVPESARSVPPHDFSNSLPDALSDQAVCADQAIENKTDVNEPVSANEVIEYAMAAARGEVERRQLEPESELPTGEAIPVLPEEPTEEPTEAPLEAPFQEVAEAPAEVAVKAPPLPDPVVLTPTPEAPQPIAQNIPPRRETQISKAQAALALAGLTSGARIEFRDPDGSTTVLKVTWISPHKSLYLMTNREKGRALSMGIDDLAAALCKGQARIVVPSKNHTPATAYPRQRAKKTA